MNIRATTTPEHALAYWLPADLVRLAHEVCRGLPPTPTTAHPAWNGLLAALGLARVRSRRHPLIHLDLIEVRLTVAEQQLLAGLAGLVPGLAPALKEEL
ncbi:MULTISPECIES: hypothetical protein [unclassified Crossiella]|uniref:hypothetical protein n=1 Tax=unclassified Crossiella TaxID=2620835 RepID=UPI001FFF3FAA|nr:MULTISPECIES: hypothetical protein [unclassified Crossiella]MCK2240663.1 hypothetical protein [Crossiella sp. S99.2]MCK2252886.1 hypothetical protein [Crossiella sp. S99.1]